MVRPKEVGVIEKTGEMLAAQNLVLKGPLRSDPKSFFYQNMCLLTVYPKKRRVKR